MLKPETKGAPGDCFRLFNLATSMYLTCTAPCTMDNDADMKVGPHVDLHGRASHMSLCERGDEAGMENSYFKLVQSTDEGELVDGHVVYSGYYALVSATKGKLAQVRTTDDILVKADIGKNGMRANEVPD